MLKAISRAAVAIAYFSLPANAAPNPTSTTTSATYTYTPGPGCPSPLSVKNSGFEDGVKPWKLFNQHISLPEANLTTYSPGYNSDTALRIDIPRRYKKNSYYYGVIFTQEIVQNQCYGFYYNISYAWNWLDFAYAGGLSRRNSCSFYVRFGGASSTKPGRPFPEQQASVEPGWHTHWYIAREVYECQDKPGRYWVSFECESGDGRPSYPPFTVLFDDLSVTPLDKSPYKPEPPDSVQGGVCD